MNSEILFQMALGLQTPWKVNEVEFRATDSGGQALHLTIGFTSGGKFRDESGALCPIHDTVKRQWQHLNFFEHACILHCAVPRIRDSKGKVVTVEVPWARPGSGFTLLCEAFAMALIERGMPVSRVGQMMNVNPQRIWNLFRHWVTKARRADRLDGVTRLGVDETSSKKGHEYVTLAVDLDTSRVIHVVPGKDRTTIESLAGALEEQGGKREQITQVSMDLSGAFISGVAKVFPKARVTYDRFHLVKLLNEAMDKVRVAEKLEYENRGNKYTFLKNPENLSDKQRRALPILLTAFPNLGEAYRLKILFNEVWHQADLASAETHLRLWCEAAQVSHISPMMRFAKTVKSHWSGIIAFVESKISNGVLEGINSKVQLAKRNARGYRNVENFINMIYFLCGKLNFEYPRYFA